MQETPSLRVRLLGQFDLRLDDRPLGPIESARSRSLLASVLLRPDVCWPGRSCGRSTTPRSSSPRCVSTPATHPTTRHHRRLTPAPPAPFVPTEWFGRPVAAVILVWAGEPAQGVEVMAPLRGIGTPIADVVRPVPYVALQSMLDGGAPHGRHYYWRAHRLPDLSDPVIDVFLELMGARTSPLAQVNGWAIGGA